MPICFLKADRLQWNETLENGLRGQDRLQPAVELRHPQQTCAHEVISMLLWRHDGADRESDWHLGGD